MPPENENATIHTRILNIGQDLGSLRTGESVYNQSGRLNEYRRGGIPWRLGNEEKEGQKAVRREK